LRQGATTGRGFMDKGRPSDIAFSVIHPSAFIIHPYA